MVRRFVTAAALALALSSHAQSRQEPEVEKRVNAISQELRCLVCQNQTIADSQSDLAVDLRRQVREMVNEGRSDKQIVQYMTERYGDFVVYRPPLEIRTVLLWFGPVALLAGSIVLLIRRIRRMEPGPPLSQADRERAKQLLEDGRDIQ